MKRVLVIGDVIADVYSEAYFKKACPDAPHASAYVVTGEKLYAGGAANVAMNLAVLAPDCIVDLIGVMDDEMTRLIYKGSSGRVQIYVDPFGSSRCLRKNRIIDQNGRTVIRLDQFECVPERVLMLLRNDIERYFREHDPDLILISDYNGGMLRMFRELLLPHIGKCLIDTKETDLSKLDGALMIKLNKAELDAVLQTEAVPEQYCRGLVTTLGDRGAVLHVRMPHSRYGVTVTHTFAVNGHRVSAVDVCGCGDTFLAGLAASLLLNDDMFSAMQFANAAASTVVVQSRVAVADLGRTLELVGRGSDETGTGCTDRNP